MSQHHASALTAGAGGSSGPDPRCSAALATPVGTRDAAIACIDLVAQDAQSLDRALAALLGPVLPISAAASAVDPSAVVGSAAKSRAIPRVGTAPLRTIVDRAGKPIDEAVVARWSAAHASIMPHASPAGVAAIMDACTAAGLVTTGAPTAFPEAHDALERRTLEALARAGSALAIDPLLDQPARWREAGLTPELASLSASEIARRLSERVAERPGEKSAKGAPEADLTHREHLARWRVLNCLLLPALVVCVGRPNIGKSSLLNALAGRQVSTVADEPGTTRDAVGAELDLGGLLVRWADAPGLEVPGLEAQGLEAPGLEAQGFKAPGLQVSGPQHGEREVGPTSDDPDVLAQAAAARLIELADLVVLCADYQGPWPEQLLVGAGTRAVVRVRLRTDLVAELERSLIAQNGDEVLADERTHSGFASGAVRVSSREGTGLIALTRAVREALVPTAALADRSPWVWWDDALLTPAC